MNQVMNVPEIFGSDVFTEAAMKQRLAPEVYNAWKQCIETGTPLSLDVANGIAEAMKAYEDGHISQVSESTYQAMAYGLERIGIRVAGQ